MLWIQTVGSLGCGGCQKLTEPRDAFGKFIVLELLKQPRLRLLRVPCIYAGPGFKDKVFSKY